jgi:hypothetical protein
VCETEKSCWSPAVGGTELLSFQRRTKDRIAGVCVEGEQLIYGVGELKLAGLQPNFNYVLSFEITCNSWQGEEHCAVNSGVTTVQGLSYENRVVLLDNVENYFRV